MDTKHTPGPWFVDDATGLRVIADGVVICEVAQHADGVGIANARRIAAVPDLLRALDRLAHVAKLLGADQDDGGALSQALAAITKATGAQS